MTVVRRMTFVSLSLSPPSSPNNPFNTQSLNQPNQRIALHGQGDDGEDGAVEGRFSVLLLEAGDEWHRDARVTNATAWTSNLADSASGVLCLRCGADED